MNGFQQSPVGNGARISQRFAATSLTSAGFALMLAMLLLIAFEYTSLRRAAIEETQAEAAVLADNLAAAVLFDDERATREIVSSLRHSTAVLRSGAFDSKRRLLGDFRRDESEAPVAFPDHLTPGAEHFASGRLELLAPILHKDGVVGHLYISKSLQPIYSRLGLYLLATLVIVAGALLAASVLVRRAHREISRAEEKLETLAHIDAVTGLENRHAFNERLRYAVELAGQFGERVAVLALDLDNFKSVNDTLGHQAGDELLRMVAHRLRNALRHEDTLCRIGGDEFSVILPRLRDDREMVVVGEKVTQVCAESYRIEGQDFFVTISVGIAVFPYHAQDIAGLVSSADRAMYRAKEAGKNTWRLFSAEMNDGLVLRVAMENALWKAIERGEMDLHYQPQFSEDGKRLIGAEALMRWSHPEFGEVSPSEFIPIAERNGQIVALGAWALRKAVCDAVFWHGISRTPVRVAVNVSARQMMAGDFVESVRSVLDEFHLAPSMLEIELTESVLMDNIHRQMEVMASLRKLGVAVAIDDFGTGYSSMAYLQRLPIDRLKIDRAFVRDLPEQVSAVAIMRAMVALAHNIGLGVTAEGVETEAQSEMLRTLGVDEQQGYLLGRPLRLVAFHELLRQRALSSGEPGGHQHKES